MAYVIPLAHRADDERGKLVILVVLTPENMERMRAADPFDVQVRNLGQTVIGFKATDVDLVVCYEDDAAMFEKIAEGGAAAVVTYLERGRRHRPERGDGAKPVSIKKEKPRHD